MPMEEEPVVGKTYEDADGVAFEILAFDEDDGTIEIQYVDGSLDEIDLDTWYEMDLQQVKNAEKSEDEEEDEEEEEDKKPKLAKDDDDDDDEDEYDDYDDDDDYKDE